MVERRRQGEGSSIRIKDILALAQIISSTTSFELSNKQISYFLVLDTCGLTYSLFVLCVQLFQVNFFLVRQKKIYFLWKWKCLLFYRALLHWPLPNQNHNQDIITINHSNMLLVFINFLSKVQFSGYFLQRNEKIRSNQRLKRYSANHRCLLLYFESK